MGVRKLSRNANFLLESPIWGYPVPAGFLPAVLSLAIYQETRVFPLEPPYGLHTHLCGLQSSLGRQLPKLNTAGRKPAGTGYPHIGDSSRKFAFLDSFRTPIAPKPEFSRNTHPCGWQGPSIPSNFQVFDSSLNSTLSRARQHQQPTHSPMHNGLDLDLPRNQSFPARTAIWATHPLVWSSILTRSPTP